ncbi:MAG: hypothetical protein NTZ14_16935 [Hyphomicrobiales bacterium]|nr:hypothetical protein [Hyphomicrobiales bacterium]
MLRAAEVSRVRPVWHEFYLYLSARTVGDVDVARSAQKALALLVSAITASDRGSKTEAMTAMQRLATMSPVLGDDAGEFLDRAFFARGSGRCCLRRSSAAAFRSSPKAEEKGQAGPSAMPVSCAGEFARLSLIRDLS